MIGKREKPEDIVLKFRETFAGFVTGDAATLTNFHLSLRLSFSLGTKRRASRSASNL